MSVGVSFEMQRLFLDRKKLDRYLDAKKRKALIRAGSFVQRRAKSLIGRVRKRRAKRGRQAKPSRPGQPPTAWQKDGIRRIFYYYDRSNDSVGIGPAQFRTGDTTGLLEHGGSVRITESSYEGGPWKPGTYQKGPGKIRRRTRNVKIQPRPFMGPALEDEQDAIMDQFTEAKSG